MLLEQLEAELAHLEAKAHSLAQEYYRFAKASGKLIKLRVRVRRHNGSLQIEWSIPSWWFENTTAKIYSRHIKKGSSESYPLRRLTRHVPPELRAKVLEYEDCFAKLRKAAKILGQIKRLAKHYQQQATQIGGANGPSGSAS